MNTISKYILQGLIAGAALFTSCKKLDVTPPDKLSTTIFWKSESDADLALMLVYGRLGELAGGNEVVDVASAPGFLSEAEIVERYAAASLW